MGTEQNIVGRSSMKKKYKLFILIMLLGIIGAVAYFISLPRGNTLESREVLLDNAIRGESKWNIVKEVNVEDYIISCGYSENDKSTIAVFAPTSNGKYKCLTTTRRHNKEIIVTGVNINNNWYDLIWFNGAQTEYAEVTYTVNNEKEKPLKYDTSEMDLICIKNNKNSYQLEVYYYDSEGNRYE